MQNNSTTTSACAEQPTLMQARDLLRSALELIDQGRAPGEIGAYVDLAICRLDEAIAEWGSQPAPG